VEQRDFAWGTSSRSSKLVHGGFRYLKEGRIFLTRASVQERERLLEEGSGLIDPLGFLLTIYEGDSPGRWTFEAGLTIYDLLALHWGHRYYCAEDFQMLVPHITQKGLEGGFRYGDAQTDDARLVLRVIREAVMDGGTALNYVKAEELLQEDEKVVGIHLRENTQPVDSPNESQVSRSMDVYAPVVINATGAWADRLRHDLGVAPRIRPLRGSHLIFPTWRLPVAQAVSFLHPLDQRPVFIFPWEGITIVGTTDVDHSQPLDVEPSISPEEVAYLMAAAQDQFPSLNLGLEDVISTFAGVRPVIGTGKVDPSKESRDHVVWEESGLLTVTGGKLTTFRLIALDVLDALRHRIPQIPQLSRDMPVLDPVDVGLMDDKDLEKSIQRRLLGRFGADAPALVKSALPGELEIIPGTQTLWAELRWAARAEGVVHLDDLLMRRVRLGVLLQGGGEDIMPAVKTICQTELGWDDARWLVEEASYLRLWQDKYSLPNIDLIPDWKEQLRKAETERLEVRSKQRKRLVVSSALMVGITTAVVGFVILLIWRKKQDR
jgi:glycerol-3-phosphate dehydrogenase